jgi:hypothetical protein
MVAWTRLKGELVSAAAVCPLFRDGPAISEWKNLAPTPEVASYTGLTGAFLSGLGPTKSSTVMEVAEAGTVTVTQGDAAETS